MDKNKENKTIDELYKIATKTKADTFLSVLGKTYNENLISDYLAYILDDSRSHLGVAPLNALLKCASSSCELKKTDKITIEREHCLNRDQKNRIDILIHIQNEKKSFYIGIENKIGSDEGTNQTTRYANSLDTFYKSKGEKNIYIFLTPTGIDAKDIRFKSISYNDIVEEFENTTLDNMFFADFKNHVKKYIVSNAFECTFTKEELDFLYAFEFMKGANFPKCEVVKYIKENSNNEDLAEEIYSYAIMLRNKLFKIIEQALKNIFSEDEYMEDEYMIEKHGFYIQFYKEKWKNEGIHFEIIIPYNKGLLFPDAEIFIMLHREKDDKVGLRRKFCNCKDSKSCKNCENFKKIKCLGFNKSENVICGDKYILSDILSNNGGIEIKISNMIIKFDIKSKTQAIDDYLNSNKN